MFKERVESIEVNSTFSLLMEPAPRWMVHNLSETLDRFAENCQKIGLVTNIPKEIPVPTLVLARNLTAAEKTALNNHYSELYAQEAVAAQEKIASIPIVESFDPMVNLSQLCTDNPDCQIVFSQTPYHAACGDWAQKPRLFWVRQAVSHQFLKYTQALNRSGFTPRVEDCFRPPGVQEGLFLRRYRGLKTDHPDWNESRLITETRSKTAVTPRLASHKGGAAIDFMLQNSEGKTLDIGNIYPEGGALVKISTPFVTPIQWLNRQIFTQTATMVGFSLYPWEDWHISYSDNLAGYDPSNNQLRTNFTAKYGPIKQFDMKSGKIYQIYQDSELDETFPHNDQ